MATTWENRNVVTPDRSERYANCGDSKHARSYAEEVWANHIDEFKKNFIKMAVHMNVKNQPQIETTSKTINDHLELMYDELRYKVTGDERFIRRDGNTGRISLAETLGEVDLRAANMLEELGFLWIDQLKDKRRNELLEIPNFGPAMLIKLEKVLDQYGIGLK